MLLWKVGEVHQVAAILISPGNHHFIMKGFHYIFEARLLVNGALDLLLKSVAQAECFPVNFRKWVARDSNPELIG
jgi:hypothetical protein